MVTPGLFFDNVIYIICRWFGRGPVFPVQMMAVQWNRKRTQGEDLSVRCDLGPPEAGQERIGGLL